MAEKVTRWIVVSGYCDEHGNVLEWEIAGSFEWIGEPRFREPALRRSWRSVAGRPVKFVSWLEASGEQRREAEAEDQYRKTAELHPPVAEEAAEAVLELARRGGLERQASDRTLLLSVTPFDRTDWKGGVRQDDEGSLSVVLAVSSPALSNEQRSRLALLTAACYMGFYDAASNGLPLVEADRIVEFYGKPLAEAYPNSGEAFFRFATTYWTMLTLLDDLRSRGLPDLVVLQLLRKLDSLLAELYFPSPGPLMVDPAKREADVRRFLGIWAPTMDVDAFVAGNPVLDEQRQLWRGGK
jgi:hypothetical protein